MKKSKEKLKYSNGITLIFLVVTIVILLILAGVSINIVLGNNGLINKSRESKTTTEISQEKEGIELAVATSRIGNNGYEKLNKISLQNAIDNQFGIDVATVIDNGDGTFIVVFITNRAYDVNSNDNISFIGNFDNKAIARIKSTYYSTLSAAINSVQDSDTIVLLKDISENITITENKDVILDTRGYSLKNETDDLGTITIDSGGILTIQGSGSIISQAPNTINNFGTLEITDAVEISSTSSNKSTIYNRDNAVLKINNETTIKSEIWQTITNRGWLEITGNAKISSKSTNSATITLSAGSLQMDGGSIISENYNAINTNVSTTVHITGGTVIGNLNSIYNKGNLEISGTARIISNSSGSSTIANGNKDDSSESGICIITGGTITNTSGEYAIRNHNGTVTVTNCIIEGKTDY